ncbi:MAG: AAA family ATPase [Candidatus Viridilinea halotolerans]|uniref:AAA family ATPase n=1 Tax=Candidatus Viridilinea halotolerans TaxID=2491704 RepID=A0A426TYS8_9CHLR|nr:MAG: AAA family ATPase [Candidatus Viridilinea halotolerans]
MQIDTLELANFRGFTAPDLFIAAEPTFTPERTFNFSTQFNVIVGDNGTGKTALLDALAIGLGSLFLGFDQIESRGIRKDEVSLARFTLGDTVSLEPQYPVVITCAGTVHGRPIRWTRTLEGSGGRITRQGALEIFAISRELQRAVRSGEPVDLPLLAYYGTGRLWLQKKDRLVEPIKPASRMVGYVDCLDPISNEKMLLRWLKTMEMSQIQQGKPLALLTAVKQAVVNSVELWHSMVYDLRLDELIITADDGRTLPFRMLSDGVRNMLAMVADIAYRAAVLNPQYGAEAASATCGVVLIDEIDLHLHPKWQRRVVEDLRRTFPRIQFIATTHSPFIIQALRPGELINLDSKQPVAYADKSIEDIAEQVMDVALPQRGERYQEMMAAAKEYYRVLQAGKHTPPDQVEALKRRLRAASWHRTLIVPLKSKHVPGARLN